MVHDSFDEFEVWSLNKSKEGKKKCFHWKIHVGEQSCALGQPSKMEPHEHTQREATGGSCHTFYFCLLC